MRHVFDHKVPSAFTCKGRRMKKMLDIATQLLNIEKHDAVEQNEHGKKYVPASVVRCMAHELIVEIRKQEQSDKEVLEHIEKAEQILRWLNVING